MKCTNIASNMQIKVGEFPTFVNESEKPALR